MTVLRADAIGNRHSLVIIASQSSGFVGLNKNSFAASLTSRTDLQCPRRKLSLSSRLGIHNERYVVPSCTHPARERLYLLRLTDPDAGIRWMVVKGNGGRHNTGAERRGYLFLIADAPGIGAVFGTKARRSWFSPIQDYRWVMGFRPKSADNILRHIHP